MSDNLHERLRSEFIRDAVAVGATEQAAGEGFAALASAYDSPSRHYHTLRHIAAVRRWVDTLQDVTNDIDAVRIAAWYHDAVYDPASAENEADSANLAVAMIMAFGGSRELAEECERLILLTEDHWAAADDPDGKTLVDADLSILGATPAKYQSYLGQIRREYEMVSDADWRVGRADIVENYLDRRTIFHTDLFLADHEAQAQQNLRHELDELQA